ncbi:ribose-phosphate pyrophosphokinase [uncultured Sphingomonas sp.]|uniref:ribose-phosphate pyrophosphokinase n=1 Tax=uncultured Sphingomonas sp. TaxID=158754 RepID=UPI0035CA5C92
MEDAPESPIANVALVHSLLVDSARAGEAISYSAFLARLGLAFSRPKMRALCRTLDRIDQDGAERGEPGLAVLVVRESDGLPGQGWWAGWRAAAMGWESDWTGPAARAFVAEEQAAAFDWWRDRANAALDKGPHFPSPE